MIKVDDEEFRTHLWQKHVQPTQQAHDVYTTSAQRRLTSCACWELRLLSVVIHFEYNNCESANLMETLFNQTYE